MRNEAIQLNVWRSETKEKTKLSHAPALIFKFLCMLVGLCLALALVYLISVNQFTTVNIMPIKHIEIKNELSNQRALVVYDLLKYLQGKSFLGIDLDKVQEDINQLAWVESVALGRQWPDRIYIDIKESIPVAIWNGKNIGLSGNVFEQENRELNLPVFQASENMLPVIIEKYIQLQNDYAGMKIYIEKIIIDDRGSISFELDNSTFLILGSKDILNKNLRAKKIMAAHNTENKTVDMRYENGFAISETNQR